MGKKKDDKQAPAKPARRARRKQGEDPPARTIGENPAAARMLLRRARRAR